MDQAQILLDTALIGENLLRFCGSPAAELRVMEYPRTTAIADAYGLA